MTSEQRDATALVEAIIADLNNRSGLGLDGIDDETKQEIRSSWITKAQAAIDRLTAERDEAVARNAFLRAETSKALELIAGRIELLPPISADEQTDIEAVARWVKAIGAEQVARLMNERDEARAALARLTTPRPIEEAPKDGTWIVGLWPDVPRLTPELLRWAGSHGWERNDDDGHYSPAHFLPLPVKP